MSQITFKSNSVTRMTTTKQYDYLNRLTAIITRQRASSAVSHNYSYNTANQRTKNTLVDGSYWMYQYDSLGQVTSARSIGPTGRPSPGSSLATRLTTSATGSRPRQVAGSTGANLRSADYTANSLNQITQRDVPGYVDVKGVSIGTNVVTVNGQTAYRKGEYFWQELPVDNGSSALWTNIIVAATGQTSVTGNVYVAETRRATSYDADGNLTNDGRFAYTWDGENRLVGMTNNTGMAQVWIEVCV